jgi:FkbM family methyltransferase
MRFIRDNLIRPGDVVIECGSHHGCSAIMLSRWVGPSGKVYAYEPGARNYEILNANLRLNNVENVIPIRAVVGSDNSVVEFHEFLNDSMGSRIAQGDLLPSKNEYSVQHVPQVALDVHKTERPSLIKIDTQGYVYQPLLGLKSLIDSQRPNLALEIDPKVAVDQYGDNFERMFELIDYDNYMYFVHFSEDEEPHQTKLSDVLPEWKRLNNFSKEIHLYAKRPRT